MRKRAIIPFILGLALTVTVVVLIYITAPLGLAGAGYVESDLIDLEEADSLYLLFVEYLMLLAPTVVLSLIAIIFYVAAPVRSRYGFVRHASRLLVVLHVVAIAVLAFLVVQFFGHLEL